MPLMHSNAQVNLAEQFKKMNEIAFNWLVDTKKQYNVKDYGFVFEKFINKQRNLVIKR